ncbi:hypothetical protein HYV12_01900 [Candidatus Dojkabacteria bacterium]|nr:hypothetical protein [Candidatus Dojkabacteria bacterium]
MFILNVLKVIFWPIPWLIDRIGGIFEVRKEDGFWLVHPLSPYGTPVSLIAMGAILFAMSEAQFQMDLWVAITLSIVFYGIGIWCEAQNYFAGAEESVKAEMEVIPYVLIQSISLAILVGIWVF